MPHFDPSRSTTNDVVWQAIIPASKNSDGTGGRSLASVMNNGRSFPATVMVTHGWSNVFAHLIAAVVAHGLGLDRFEEISEVLVKPGGVVELLRRLEEHGTAERRYWICAFCVNQHAVICRGFGQVP